MAPKYSIIAGSSHPALAHAICAHLGTRAVSTHLSRFSCGESRIEIHDSVRGRTVFIVQTVRNGRAAPNGVNGIGDGIGIGIGDGSLHNDLMELLCLIAACKTASAKRIVAVMPLIPYTTAHDQHRASGTNQPVHQNGSTSGGSERTASGKVHHSAARNGYSNGNGYGTGNGGGFAPAPFHPGSLVADLLKSAGADQVVTVDMPDGGEKWRAYFGGPVEVVSPVVWMRPEIGRWIDVRRARDRKGNGKGNGTYPNGVRVANGNRSGLTNGIGIWNGNGTGALSGERSGPISRAASSSTLGTIEEAEEAEAEVDDTDTDTDTDTRDTHPSSFVLVALTPPDLGTVQTLSHTLDIPYTSLSLHSQSSLQPRGTITLASPELLSHGPTAVVVTCLVDRPDTVIGAAKVVKSAGAGAVVVVATHRAFRADGAAAIEACAEVDRVVVTDSTGCGAGVGGDGCGGGGGESGYNVKMERKKGMGIEKETKIAVVGLASILAHVISRIQNDGNLEAFYRSVWR